MNQEIGVRIRQHRQKKGYSQQYMASKLKISATTYSRIETGIVEKVNPQIFFDIAELLEVDPTEIFFPEDRQVFYQCHQSGNKGGTINNTNTDVGAFLKIIQQQMEVMNAQVAMLLSKLGS